ncbi:hypothetical protein BDY19DRAFT_925676 [Irpex rosettiformis]|uniref:Uncharacterized protein n=1 Tax=Irpex rosettiformis TaxID=378272 RepID=A0ACB8UEN3_9APHY|nr:hypothetical protein BDY19DRAFT_925676 [Irpex rosettiformis]
MGLKVYNTRLRLFMRSRGHTSLLVLNMPSSSFETFIGPTFIMTSFSFMLYGAFCAQLYFYWANYNDHVLLQSVVVLVALLETAHTGLCMHILYKYLVSAWGDLLAVQKIIPTVTALFYIDVVNVTLVQGWYIRRIWRLRKQVIPVAFLISLLIAWVGLSLRANAYLNQYDAWVDVLSNVEQLKELNANYSISVVFDTTITSLLIFYLYRDRSRVVKRGTRRIIMSLINLSLSTGALLALARVGILISLNVSKDSITYGGIVQISNKLYANSMLASLNARQIIVQAADIDTTFAVELSHAPVSVSSVSSRIISSPLQFRTQTVTTTDVEDSEVIANKGPDDNVDSKDSASLRVFHAVKEAV